MRLLHVPGIAAVLSILSLALVLFLAPGCASNRPVPEPAVATAAPLHEVFTNYYNERLRLFPIEATFAGDSRFNHLLPNGLADTQREAMRAFFRNYRAALEPYRRIRLSAEDRLSCDVLAWECETSLAQLEFPTHLLPIDQFNSLHLLMGQWAGGTGAQPFRTVQDYDNWLKRLDAFTEWCRTAVVNMRRGMAHGYVLPRALTQKVITQMADLARGPADKHLFYSPIGLMPKEFTPAERERLTAAYAGMVRDKIIPAFEELHSFLKQEYLPASRSTSGISATPLGRKYYDLQIRIYTTTDMSADEVFALGQKEVRRLLGEMEGVKESVGFQGTLHEFFEHVRNRKELMPFSDPQQVIDNFNDIHRRMIPALNRLFNRVPRTPFEVRRTEAFREATASAEYNPGSLDGTRPGIFYVPIPDVRKYTVVRDEDLFLHEAIPGHHYQISLQQENTALPQFRRILTHSAYVEGWALYCESLGRELGLYRDPYQYFGMLSADMHRAIRLVVDSGIHAKGWTREQAIQYSLEHEPASERAIVAEIERYMAWPGQALSYKVGQLKILELRARAEKALGAKFDVREFHDEILAPGCVPLQLLELRIDRWIAARNRRG